MTDKTHAVVVLGASDDPERYSNMAVRLLKAGGFDVIPVHPKLGEVEGIPVVHELAHIRKPVDTVTLYIGPERSATMVKDVIALRPRRVIFNPGTESHTVEMALKEAGIETLMACTLVLLNSGRF